MYSCKGNFLYKRFGLIKIGRVIRYYILVSYIEFKIYKFEEIIYGLCEYLKIICLIRDWKVK